MISKPGAMASCACRTVVVFCVALAGLAAISGQSATNGYIAAVLRADCASAPPPPPLGGTNVGSNYVIMTVADADPGDFNYARQVVTDDIFELLMPLYCSLPRGGKTCLSDNVQWSIITYDVHGNPVTSGCAASGCDFHSCTGFGSGPPTIDTQPADDTVNAGQAAKFTVEASGTPPLSYQWFFDRTNELDGATNATLTLAAVQTNQAGTYQVEISSASGSTNSRAARLTVNPGPAAILGYITAALLSDCADEPPPPPVGAMAVGPNYVIMTVADADPSDFAYAQEVATDAIFESLMPLYCELERNTNTCVSDAVQWRIIMYDANGNPMASGCAASGCEFRSCAGYESGPPTIVGQPGDVSVNSGQSAEFSVDASGASPLSYQWVFNGTNVLGGETNSTLVLTSAQTNQAGTYRVEISNSLGSTNSRAATLAVNPGPAATVGYITAVLRSDCANAPTPPPPVGSTIVGTNYVIMTVADADPGDFAQAQQAATDAIFESLMPLYCALPRTTKNCVSDDVQWGIITYDVNGRPLISGCAASGCESRSCAGGTPQIHLPVLTVSPPSTNVGLSWPAMDSDFVLEESSNMVNWCPVSGPLATNFDKISAQVPPPANGHFYRLRHR